MHGGQEMPRHREPTQEDRSGRLDRAVTVQQERLNRARALRQRARQRLQPALLNSGVVVQEDDAARWLRRRTDVRAEREIRIAVHATHGDAYVRCEARGQNGGDRAARAVVHDDDVDTVSRRLEHVPHRTECHRPVLVGGDDDRDLADRVLVEVDEVPAAGGVCPCPHF